MKILKTGMLLLFVFFTSTGIKAQHVKSIKITEGTLSPLKDEKIINIQFTYDSMKVGKYDKEADFVNFKKEEFNKKEAGKGDTWATKWVDDRAYKFEPAFNESFQKSSGISAGSQKDAKYTLIVHTIFTEPGFSTGWLVKKDAEINAEVIMVETANKSNILARISIEKALGNAYGLVDFDTGARIAASYTQAGKALGKVIKN
jgi:hypothetical protein